MKNAKQSKKISDAFQLKGSLFTLTVLHLHNADSKAFVTQLTDTVKRTPNFFKNAPVVIDLKKVNHPEQAIDFACIDKQLRQHGIIPVGVRNGSEQQQQAAVNAGLGLLFQNNATNNKNPSTATKKVKPTTKIITQPIRSGQQIYAEDADLVVLAMVSPGAELLADGNIHVYGALRGRALAGVKGNKEARIFCQKLDAQLISIAGIYNINVPHRNHGSQILLRDDKLEIEAIG